MALKVETTIRNMTQFSRRSWMTELGSGDDYDVLLQAQRDCVPVKVISKETDGYFNVQTADGYAIDGLSYYHLNNFNENGPDL